MAKIAILGNGNVGYHLQEQFASDHEVIVFSRNPKEAGIQSLDSFRADGFGFVFVTVSDDAILEVAGQFQTTNSIVIHTSGSRPLSDLAAHERTAVMYPLQTFSKDRKVSFDGIKLFVECSENAEEEVLGLAKSLSSDVIPATSEERAKIHLAAVFACNFSNHMFHLASLTLKQVGLDFKDLGSLVDETVNKAMTLSPSNAQTGPAIRKDLSTMAIHESLIEDEQMREIYRMVSQNIQLHS